jgi:hypothetical protein
MGNNNNNSREVKMGKKRTHRRCVAHETDALIAQGVLTQQEGDELISSAAQSDIGKK